MLSQSRETRIHNVRDRWLRDHERVGNAPEGFYATLQRLRKRLAAARYGDGALTIKAEEMPGLVTLVRTMIDHAAGRVGAFAAAGASSTNTDASGIDE